jgi:hypothetical protein
MEFSPINLTNKSCLVPLATPEPSVLMLPKSPTCLSSSSGAPWVLENGLKCGPAEVHPLVLSPNWWTWNPLKEFGSLPAISQVMVVGPSSVVCSKFTTPDTLESPLNTATMTLVQPSQHTISHRKTATVYSQESIACLRRAIWPGHLNSVTIA